MRTATGALACRRRPSGRALVSNPVEPMPTSPSLTETQLGASRLAVAGPLGSALESLLAQADVGSNPVTVLDCGGGSGSLAVPLARAGADVTVLDVSIDALSILRRRAIEAGVDDRVHAIQADVETSLRSSPHRHSTSPCYTVFWSRPQPTRCSLRWLRWSDRVAT